MSNLRSIMRYLNPYDIHKAVINQYLLNRPGDTRFLKRDSSADRNDLDVLKDNHKFLWDDETPETWEGQFAKRYYDKLFKEYCIGDLSRYKENKVALRWRTEQEVVTGKGQFICGNKKCQMEEDLKTWEVNFAYMENGDKKNALVKIRLCPECSHKLNFHKKRKEIKRLKDRSRKSKFKLPKNEISSQDIGVTDVSQLPGPSNIDHSSTNESPWENHKPIESKTRDEEMEDYLQELLL